MIFARESLVLGAVMMVPALIYVFRREQFGKFWSISLHASAHRETTIAFGAGLLAASAFLAAYFQQWLAPKYDYGLFMQALLWVMTGCFIVLALVPHHEGRWQGSVHVLTSWVMVLCMPLMLLLHALHTFPAANGIAVLIGIALQLMLLGIFYGVKACMTNL